MMTKGNNHEVIPLDCSRLRPCGSGIGCGACTSSIGPRATGASHSMSLVSLWIRSFVRQSQMSEAWGNHRHEQSICVHEQSIRVQEKSLMARQCKQTNCDVWCIVLFWFRKSSFDSKNKEELIEWEALESNSQKSRESCIPLSCAHPISDGTRKLSTLCCPPWIIRVNRQSTIFQFQKEQESCRPGNWRSPLLWLIVHRCSPLLSYLV